MTKLTTAGDMAKSIGVDPNAFRQLLSNAKFRWHKRNDWEVEINGAEFSAMRTVLVTLLKPKSSRGVAGRGSRGAVPGLKGMIGRFAP
jgi:hypothetical protein